ncbi:hypothetical protein AAG906_030617 [Vitis piasezkii]
MSCNGCRVLRKGCSDSCILRTCLQWIENPEAQGYATLFVSKFFGRSDLMSFISAVPENKRPALFQSLLFEACGRTVNPVNGAVGLLWTGNWHVCQAAVDTVLAGGTLRPIPGILAGPIKPGFDEASATFCTDAWKLRDAYSLSKPFMRDNASEEAKRIETQPPHLGISATARFSNKINAGRGKRSGASFCSEGSSGTMSYDGSDDDRNMSGCQERKLLNLFI